MKVQTDAETSPMAWTKEMTGWWSVEEEANCFLFVQNRSEWQPTERAQKWPFGTRRVLYIKKSGTLSVAFESGDFTTNDHYTVKGSASIEYWTRNPYKASQVNINLQERVLARLQAALQAEFVQRPVKDLSLQIDAIIQQVTKALKPAKESLGIEIILLKLAQDTTYQKVEEDVGVSTQRLVDRRNQMALDFEKERLQIEVNAMRIRMLGSAETDVANERLKGQLQLLQNEQSELMRLTGFLSQNPQIADAVAKLLSAYSETRDTQERLRILQNWLSGQGAPMIGSSATIPPTPLISRTGTASSGAWSEGGRPDAIPGRLPADSQDAELMRAIETDLPGARVRIEAGSQRSRRCFVEHNGESIRFTISEDKISDLRYADGRVLSFPSSAQVGPLVNRVRTFVRDVFSQLGV